MKFYLKFFFLMTVNFLFCMQQEYEVHNMSINSKYAELGVTFTATNKLVFASSKKLLTDKPFIKNRRKHNRELYLALFEGSIDQNGNIIKPKLLSNEIFNKFYEFDFDFTPDLKKIYFTSINNNSEKSKKTLNIFSANFNKNFHLSNITPLRYNSKSYSLRNPKVSKDGKHLFVSSNMENGFGEYDLYVLDILDSGSHGPPRNLGPNINTVKSELFPFIDEHNTLYFSSYGHDNSDNLNIYKSELVDGIYQKPKKLPYPINSLSDDFGFVINSEGNRGYFTSNRENGKGDVDIYTFKPKPKKCFQTLSGSIFNTENGEQLDNTEITLISNNSINDRKKISRNFEFKLKCKKTYKLNIEKNGFQTLKYIFKTTGNTDHLPKKDFHLYPVNCNQVLTGIVFDKNTGKPLTKSKLKLFKHNKLVDSLLTDHNSKYRFTLNCNTPYRLTVSSNNYVSEIETFRTSNILNNNISKNFYLESNIEFIIIREQKMVYIEPIQFELNEANLRNDSKKELIKVINILIKYPTIKLEINSHTDSRAPDSYNLNLSNNRVKSIKKYLIAKGIDQNRISGRGYGETLLLNKCTNGVKCSEDEHQLNRRTEFIVINE